MHDWELVVQFFGCLFFEVSVALVPACAFEEETVDVNSFLRGVDVLSFDSSIISLDDFFEGVSGVLYFIEGPCKLFLLSGDFLLDSS